MTPTPPDSDLPPPDGAELQMPFNGRVGVLVLVAIVLVCLGVTLILVWVGGVGALVWQ